MKLSTKHLYIIIPVLIVVVLIAVGTAIFVRRGSAPGASPISSEVTPLGETSGSPDTDGDGLPEKQEINLGRDPLVADFTLEGPDTDKDGVPDEEEARFGTDSNKTDTDDDGVLDNDELDLAAQGTKDTDNDGLYDPQETILGTDPNKADTDGDGYKDGSEVMNGYNPLGAGKL